MSAIARTRYAALRGELIVNDFWFGPRVERTKMRQTLGLAPGAVVMVTVARLTRRQGHLATLNAASRTPASVRDRLTWLIVGAEAEADYTEELMVRSAAANCDVRVLGPLSAPEIRDVYCASDLFCLTALGPTGVADPVYLEAAACGLPSIATAISGDTDTVIDNETGRLVEPSVEAISKAITELTLDGIKRISLGWRAWARVRKINWECGGKGHAKGSSCIASFAGNLESMHAAVGGCR
jgi:phosphatidylinositol alpha-1,6-mannosyltransferase